MEALILQELRENSELRCEDGEDTIHEITMVDGKPVVSSFTCGYMDDLRERVNAEIDKEAERCVSSS